MTEQNGPRYTPEAKTGLFIIVMIVLSLFSLQRNRTSADPVTLWSDAASKSPRK